MGIIPKLLPTSLNNAIASTTVISSSSVYSGFPRLWLRDATPSKPWQSLPGFNVVAGFNDKIRFKIGAGSNLIATIAPGNYNGFNYCIAVVNALTSAGANAWTMTWNGTTGIFTYGGTSDWTFQGTISEPATALPDLGVSGTADTTSTTHALTTAIAVYKTREFLAFDFGAAVGVTAGLVYIHNSAALGTYTLQGKASASPWNTPAFTQNLTGDDLTRMRVAFFAAQSYRYWAIIIDDRSNSAGFSSVGVAYVGTYWSPSTRSFNYSFNYQSVSKSEIVEADQGSLQILKRQSPRKKHLDFKWLPRTDAESYLAIENEHAHCFFALNPTNYPAKDTWYGVIDGLATITDAGSPQEFFHLNLEIRENIG